MSRRKGHQKLLIGTRSDGSEYFYFQYWLDIPGKGERKRRREIIGPVKTKTGGLTKTEAEAEAKKVKFLADLNGRFLALPSSKTFADVCDLEDNGSCPAPFTDIEQIIPLDIFRYLSNP